MAAGIIEYGQGMQKHHALANLTTGPASVLPAFDRFLVQAGLPKMPHDHSFPGLAGSKSQSGLSASIALRRCSMPLARCPTGETLRQALCIEELAVAPQQMEEPRHKTNANGQAFTRNLQRGYTHASVGIG